MDSLLLKTERSAVLASVRPLRHLLNRVTRVCAINETLRHRIELCFSEAATNVIEHADPAAVTLGLRFGRNGDHWWLEVLDDGGPWLSAGESLNKLSSEQQEAESGRGLGLIEGQSDHQLYQPTEDNKKNRLRLSWVRSRQPHRPQVLVVEDDTALRHLYTAYLADHYEVNSVSGGDEALAWLQQNPVDLVLSDIGMPGMDGMALREQLVEQPDTELTPFIFLTANEEETSIQRAGHLASMTTCSNLLPGSSCCTHCNGSSHGQIRCESVSLNVSTDVSVVPSCPTCRRTFPAGASPSPPATPAVAEAIYCCTTKQRFRLCCYWPILWGMMTRPSFLPMPMAVICAASCRGRLRSVIREPCLRRCQRQLDDDLLQQATLTAMAISLEEGGRLTLASGGHPAPLIMAARCITPVSVGGVLPGLLPDNRYDPVELHLQAGERLALFTDGLFESAESELGRRELEQSIIEILQQTRLLPQEEALRRVMERFDQQAGRPAGDDTLLLLLERTD